MRTGVNREGGRARERALHSTGNIGFNKTCGSFNEMPTLVQPKTLQQLQRRRRRRAR